MFRSLLVPIDETPQSAAALPLARAIARATGGTLHLLEVVPPSDVHAHTRAESRLLGILPELVAGGLPASSLVRRGEPATEIVAAARELVADLIIMATHTKGSQSMLALTSVAREVLSHSCAPVLLVRPGAIRTQHIRTLLVPVDGSPGASLALASASALAHATGARLVLLRVVVPITAEAVQALPGMTLGGFIDPAWGVLAQQSAEEYVHRLAAQVGSNGLTCEPRVTVGEVAAEIARSSADCQADLVVMSTHTRNWPGDALVTSVALEVLEHGDRPVLVVRREPLQPELDADSSSSIHLHQPALQRVLGSV